jgi:predicted transcriptional regulator
MGGMVMSDNIQLRPDLSERLQKNAYQSQKSVSELVNEAVEQYLHTQQRQIIDREIEAYIQLHPTLWRTIPNHWVAIHNGEVVDQDSDRISLNGRVRAKYGQTPVLIRQVQKDVNPEILVRTPSRGKISS